MKRAKIREKIFKEIADIQEARRNCCRATLMCVDCAELFGRLDTYEDVLHMLEKDTKK